MDILIKVQQIQISLSINPSDDVATVQLTLTALLNSLQTLGGEISANDQAALSGVLTREGSTTAQLKALDTINP